VALNQFMRDSPYIWGLSMWEKDLTKLKAVLSANLKTLRQEKGVAQERLGLESGVDRTLISKIERQIANPSIEILSKIAAYLGVSVVELLTKKK
jgi:DNA-binding XRE family transcriptional regulator